MNPSQTIPLLEVTQEAWAGARAEREASVLANICLLGSTSRNGRRYPERVLKEALAMFEGCKAYLNHPSPSKPGGAGGRDVRDLIGRFSSPRIVEGKLKADLRVLPQHAELIFALATQMPDLVGMSINARGRTCLKETTEIVEAITEVRSVDLVTDPAATNSLFESVQNREQKEVPPMDWSQLTLETLAQERPDIIEAIEKPLIEQIEESKLRDQLQERRTHVQNAIEKAGLPSLAVTELFTRSLMEAQNDAQLQALIQERLRLVSMLTGKPESREKSLPSKGERPSDDEMYGPRT